MIHLYRYIHYISRGMWGRITYVLSIQHQTYHIEFKINTNDLQVELVYQNGQDRFGFTCELLSKRLKYISLIIINYLTLTSYILQWAGSRNNCVSFTGSLSTIRHRAIVGFVLSLTQQCGHLQSKEYLDMITRARIIL